ncbi:MAG: protein kinase [Kofleriaceae bacterium]
MRSLGVTAVTPQPPRTPTAFPAGTRVGKYEIIRVLGRGGMGQVYLARDVVLGRRVAIKFMLDVRSSFVERFHAEARATARCQHENIVVIHEIGDYHGHGFMVLEYLEGETLAPAIKTAPQPAQAAVELMVPVARALVHAHAHGIVHRDLKPENVFVTVEGSVKVLDFGIARAFDVAVPAIDSRAKRLTGTIVGTPMYMAPEQHRGDAVDHRADIWAFGLILHELVTGQHPLAPRGEPDDDAIRSVGDPDRTMPTAASALASLPYELVALIDRCLAKNPGDRFGDARELLEALEAIGPGRNPRRSAEESPYPGLSAFGDGDADVFFGRTGDVRRAIARLRDQPMVGVVGPSGVGKSSFVRAGIGPALASAEPWELFTLRPGRDALRSLASLVLELGDGAVADEATAIDRLRAEPGYLAEVLRARARATRRRILISVDQFEELYTLVPAVEDRAAYVACLVAIADDVAAPLRVVVAMRSDFLDRIAEHAELLAHLSRCLLFLAPLDRVALREALTHPARLAGYTFESDGVVDDVIDALEQTSGALPLLQFIANKMWDARDRNNRQLTAAAYQAMGGVTGAIAAHADQVVADLSAGGQREVRGLFQRLVTPERTRAIVELRELTDTSTDRAATLQLIDTLVRARLLVVSGDGDRRTVEIVHDSLITGWPRLAGWIEDEKEIVAFAIELRTAAKNWDDRGRLVDLLWRGEILANARRLRPRLADRGALTDRERSFLDAALSLDERALRIRRRLVIAAIAILAAVAAGATVALLWIRGAEREARWHAQQAQTQAREALAARDAAAQEAARAKTAQDEREREHAQRRVAEQQAQTASSEVALRRQDLEVAYRQLAAALEEQRREADRARGALAAAERETSRAQRAEEDVRAKQRALQELLDERNARVNKLEEQLRKISVELK